MPYNTDSGRHRVASSSVKRLHGAACHEEGYVGIAQKQVQPGATIALAEYPYIQVAEAFTIITTGKVEVPTVTSAARGSTIWINVDTQALSLTDPGSSDGMKFGRVDALAGEEGVPTGFMRVDLDKKDSF